mmetsp:Transcript_81402/g.218884  ORF Transcript_81402/g.218884 Transcript_81402/m.218884 type:complete len:372 (+) Transcript_81402:10-1125(+)
MHPTTDCHRTVVKQHSHAHREPRGGGGGQGQHAQLQQHGAQDGAARDPQRPGAEARDDAVEGVHAHVVFGPHQVAVGEDVALFRLDRVLVAHHVAHEVDDGDGDGDREEDEEPVDGAPALHQVVHALPALEDGADEDDEPGEEDDLKRAGVGLGLRLDDLAQLGVGDLVEGVGVQLLLDEGVLLRRRLRLLGLLLVGLDGLAGGGVARVHEGDDDEDGDEPRGRDVVEEHPEDAPEQQHGLHEHHRLVVDERPVGLGVAALDVEEVVGHGAPEDGGLGQRDAKVRREVPEDEVHWDEDAAAAHARRRGEHNGHKGDERHDGVVHVDGEKRLVAAAVSGQAPSLGIFVDAFIIICAGRTFTIDTHQSKLAVP